MRDLIAVQVGLARFPVLQLHHFSPLVLLRNLAKRAEPEAARDLSVQSTAKPPDLRHIIIQSYLLTPLR
jgi:fatty acid desaturase